VEIVQDNKGRILAEKIIPSKGKKQDILSVTLNTADLKLHDGPATIKVSATDYSLFRNQQILFHSIRIDTIPPQINLLKTVNYINQGGTGYIAYQSPEKLPIPGFMLMIILSPAIPH